MQLFTDDGNVRRALLIAACAAIVMSAALAGWNMIRIWHMSHGHGYIADVDEGSGKMREWRVRIVFYTETDHRFSFMTTWHSSGRGSTPPQNGREVNILYDPVDPQRTAEIDNPTERWVGSMMLFTLGAILFSARHAQSRRTIGRA